MSESNKLYYSILDDSGIKYNFYNAQRHYRLWRNSTKGAYKNMSCEELSSSIKQYIRESLPQEYTVEIEKLSQFGIDYSGSLHKQLESLGIEVMDTLQGYYIPNNSKVMIQEYIENYASLLELFCSKTGIKDSNDRDYRDFIKRCRTSKTNLVSIPFHPKVGTLFFHITVYDAVNQTLIEWINCRKRENHIVPAGCISLFEASELLDVDIYTMFKFAYAHADDIVVSSEYIYPIKSSVSRWATELSESRKLYSLIENIRKEFKSISKQRAHEEIHKQIRDNLEYIYNGQSLIGKNKEDWFYNISCENKVIESIRNCFNNLPVFPISVIKQVTGFSDEELINAVNKELIKANKIDDEYLFCRNEITRIENYHKTYISLEDFIAQIVSETDSVFDFKYKKCKEDLYVFIESNEFWGMDSLTINDIPINTDKYFISRKAQNNLRHRLILWIESYGKQNAQKVKILLNHYKSIYPKTCQSLLTYFSNNNNSGCVLDDKAVVDMIDRLISVINSELSEMSEDEIQDVIEQFKEFSLVSSSCLRDFLFDNGYTNKKYIFDGTGISKDNSAYELQAFSVMAYSALNQESWEAKELIQKAVNKKRYADLWLFVALHFFAAWRTTDFRRLQAPNLLYPAIETLNQIKEGKYKEEDAKVVALRFLGQIQLSSLTPNKTSNYRNVPELHFFCPQSCEYPLGIILSIATAHFELNPTEPQFVRCIQDIRTIEAFFGTEFLDACNYKQFSSLRANKALMQGVETIADGEEKKGVPRPYILASLMRSHKGGYGTLAKSTAIYLRDANFTGYTPSFIAEQMFERGVCSFVANELLRICIGDDYKKLSVPAQTKMIKKIGLTAGEIEKIVRTSQKAEDDAIELVRDMLGNDDIKEKAGTILSSLLTGGAVGKDIESLCVLRASGRNCDEKMRLSCFGCKYEIKTKALLLHYVYEYYRISEELKDKNINSNIIEVKRRRYIINNAIYPNIEEILITLESNITADEFMEYKNLVEVGLRYGD